MQELRKGQRLALADVLSGAGWDKPFRVQISIEGLNADIDFACFGLDGSQQLRDDRYLVYYNQPQTPCGSVAVTQQGESIDGFLFHLSRLPATIDRLTITAALDGAETMSGIRAGRLTFFTDNDHASAVFVFSGSDFQDEKALMLGELYRKDSGWRFAATGQGFNGGLAALVHHFGGEVADDGPSEPTVTLEKKIAEAAPPLLELAQKATVALAKQPKLPRGARVGLVLDASFSMNRQYAQGRIQEIINRVLPLAVHFDDDGALDVWAFSDHALALPPATLNNYADYIDTIEGGWRHWDMMSFNNEPAVMHQVLEYYQGTCAPVWLIFISDGGIKQSAAIKRLLREASSQPIFWQFVGISGRNYGILEKLDTLPGRMVDNCDFFALDDLSDISEQQLYDRLLQAFPIWLAEAQTLGILPSQH